MRRLVRRPARMALRSAVMRGLMLALAMSIAMSDGAGEADGVGAAMAFHHHAVQPQENAAGIGAGIELAAQGGQRAGRHRRAQTG